MSTTVWEKVLPKEKLNTGTKFQVPKDVCGLQLFLSLIVSGYARYTFRPVRSKEALTISSEQNDMYIYNK